MISTPLPHTLTAAQDEVEDRMRHGARFDDVETAIDASTLSDESKSACWLLALSFVSNRRQRRYARGYAQLLGARGPIGHD